MNAQGIESGFPDPCLSACICGFSEFQGYTWIMLHPSHDAVGLEIARRIARGLKDNPKWIELAKSNLQRWSRLNGDAPGLLACYREWQELLQRPAGEIASILVAQTDHGQRLRQNSPFAGILSPAEIWKIKRQIHEATAA